ncbi:MAG TPA: ABC transporter permease [Actinocrinis sp.]|uniref:ABC transporter permease n=1 Tax=Actinocrinis sp. TaxID=1920516 RepID=UPI002DDCC915|nr:ABC transporter permease [Actinocrinis sp.]HEV2347648.1 ABC transporter permease [Actinocrinis sp.]
MNNVRLTFVQLGYVNKAFWRNPAAAVFIFAFPLMFLVIFTALLGHGYVHLGGRSVHQSTYYVASMGSFAVISATYNYIAISMAFHRDNGVLKRTDGTPLPTGVFFAARLVHALLVSVLLIVITVAFGRLVYQADIPSGGALARFAVMLVVGAAAFSALGFAVTAIIPNVDAAAPVVNATILPLLFLSGVFIPLGDDTPHWLVWIARVFPVRHFAEGMQAGFVNTAFHWSDVLIVGLWGVAGVLLAVRFFSWEPRV